jgi:sulfofructose kinase
MPKPRRILCAGIVVLDELFRVKDFPPPDGKVEASAYVTIGGGNAANAAITIARLGGKASYAGPVGDDAAGDRILANLAREKVDTGGCVRVPGTASPVSAIFVNAQGERSIVTHRGAQLSATRPADGAALVSAVDGVLIDNRMASFARPIAEAARARNLPVVFDADKATTADDPLFSLATHVIFSSECLRQTVGEDDLAAGVTRMARLTRRFCGGDQRTRRPGVERG